MVLRGETAFLDGKVLAQPGFGKDLRETSFVKLQSEFPAESLLSPDVLASKHATAERKLSKSITSFPIRVPVPTSGLLEPLEEMVNVVGFV